MNEGRNPWDGNGHTHWMNWGDKDPKNEAPQPSYLKVAKSKDSKGRTQPDGGDS